MTALSFKQFVPSSVCLKCDGCCRYKEANSIWRPRAGMADKESLADLITTGDVLDDQGYIKTIVSCGKDLCRFLKPEDNTCGVYDKRPFECELYPFILSRTADAVKAYVHLSCPFVQDNLPQGAFETYVAYLKEFFRRAETRAFLLRNKAMFHDYSAYAAELLHLFDLPFYDIG